MVNPLEFLRSSRKKKSNEDEAPTAPAEAPIADSIEEVAAAEDGVEAEPTVENAGTSEDESAEEAASDVPEAPDTALRSCYGEALQAAGRFFQAVKQRADGDEVALPIAEIEAAAVKLVAAMADEESGDELIALAVGAYPDDERFIVPHSVNVAVLSQRVARQVGIEGDELHTLTIAALIHDVGTVQIPKEVFYKEDSLSNEEWEMMRQRPAHSAEIIEGLGPDYRAVAEIAHQVHERLDGSGYPRALQVTAIALEASILGAVDIFEAFIHPRPYKKTVPAAAMYGVDNLMRMSHQFGDGVLKALVRSVGLFPVGTYVRLNSGEVARVLKGRAANPMRPEVEVVFDTQKRRLSQKRYIDLMSTPHLYVFKPMSPEDLVEYGVR